MSMRIRISIPFVYVNGVCDADATYIAFDAARAALRGPKAQREPWVEYRDACVWYERFGRTWCRMHDSPLSTRRPQCLPHLCPRLNRKEIDNV